MIALCHNLAKMIKISNLRLNFIKYLNPKFILKISKRNPKINIEGFTPLKQKIDQLGDQAIII